MFSLFPLLSVDLGHGGWDFEQKQAKVVKREHLASGLFNGSSLAQITNGKLVGVCDWCLHPSHSRGPLMAVIWHGPKRNRMATRINTKNRRMTRINKQIIREIGVIRGQ